MFMALLVMLAVSADGKGKKKQQPSLFPDGTPIPAWFSDTTRVDMNQLGKQYVITDYGVRADDSTLVQTEAIQPLSTVPPARVGASSWCLAAPF